MNGNLPGATDAVQDLIQSSQAAHQIGPPTCGAP